MQSSTLPLRAVQLDLARQKESLQAVGDFILFAAEWGFDTLFLYLEGAVRTETFSQRDPAQSYDESEIRQILEMASAAGLGVIPGLATLGHANHFLQTPELAHLRETGSWSPNMFCPSHPGTYELVESYVKEIAAWFPSPHVHIGCDETWALGSCPVCRERLRHGESREDLFVRHVSRLRDFLHPLGKRTWIWSDMLETFSPGVLDRIPKDVVLCEWHYGAEQMSHDGFQGHFNNLNRRDALTLYQQSGHDTVLCGAGSFSGGSEWNSGLAITEVGRKRPPFGWLLTNWSMTATFLPEILPVTAVMGRIWSHPDEGESVATETVLDALFPNAAKSERLILRYSFCGQLFRTRLQDITHRGELSVEEMRCWHAAQAGVEILQPYTARLSPGRERDMVEEVLYRMRLEACLGTLRGAAARLVDLRSSEPATREAECHFQQALGELANFTQTRSEKWDRMRPGIHPYTPSGHLEKLAESLHAFFVKLTHASRETRGILNLRLCLIECHSAPRLCVEIFDGTQWIGALCGSYKPVNLRDASYSLAIPLFWENDEPQKLRITVTGYGGQGVQFASVLIGSRKWVPQSILDSRGQVRDAGKLLRDDAFVCFLGEQNTLKTVKALSDREQSVVEIQLAPLP